MNSPKIAVVGIVEFEDQVLVGKKIASVGHQLSEAWHIPGGKAHPDETPEAALIREIKEETRLDIKIVRLLDERHVPEANLIVKWYLCTPISHDLVPGDDLAEVKYVSKPDLKKVCDLRAISLWPPKVVEYLDPNLNLP